MKVDRMDTFDGVMYVMTENHIYPDVLKNLRTIEPGVYPIKHVNADRASIATGYKIPVDTPELERLLAVLKEASA